MEIIGVILFVLFFIVSAGSKNKKRGNAAQRPGTTASPRQQAPAANPRAAQAARPVQPARQARPVAPASGIPKNLNELKAAMNQWLEDGMAEIKADIQPPVEPAAQPVQGASMLDDDQCAGGSMPHTHDEGHSALEDEDCAGGSMEHTHTEGVSRATHARRIAAYDAADTADARPEAIDARALRRAVVMAEVLGKPRALRKF